MRLIILLLGISALSVVALAQQKTISLNPASLVDVSGSHDLSVSALNSNDQFGSDNDPTKYIELLGSSQSFYEGVFSFALSAGSANNLVEALVLNVRNQAWTYQAITFETFVKGVWIPFGERNIPPSAVWETLVVPFIEGTPLSYIATGNSVLIRLRAVSVLSKVQLDFIQLALSPGSTRAVRDVGEQDTLVYLSRLEDVHGIHSDQLISALSIKDSEGSMDNWDNYVEFYAIEEQFPYEGNLYFSVPTMSPVLSTTLTVNYRGDTWDVQGFSFDIYDVVAAQFIEIGNTFFARDDDGWNLLTLDFPSTVIIADVINSGVLLMRIRAKTLIPGPALDFIELSFHHQPLPPVSPWYTVPLSSFTTGYNAPSATNKLPYSLCSTQGFIFAPHLNSVAPPKRSLPSWMYGARIAHAGFSEDASDLELNSTLSPLLSNGVTVAEVDNVLSDWNPVSVFDTAVRTSAAWSSLVHKNGVATIWYYPALEIISHNINISNSYSVTYPDELQVGISGEPNKFYYPQVFWLAPGDESAWLSPNGPYKQKYIDNVKRIAVTGVDGLWMDVPVYFDTMVKWGDHSIWGANAFKNDTGLTIPTIKNWADPVWRRWVAWRHDNILNFLLDVAREGRSVNPNFQFIVETYVCDYHDATLAGYDGAYLRKQEGLTIVWEVSATSDSHGMRFAYEDDWTSLIAMYKYGRGAVDYSKPSWAFSYGIASDDAIAVIAETIAAGNAPYEVKTPGKEEGVSGNARNIMFSFIRENADYLYDTISAARVAIIHSTPSRDYVDNGEGNGLFCSMGPPASLVERAVALSNATGYLPPTVEWYSDSGGPESDSCYKKQWIGEYRGIVKALINSHIPFNILPTPGLEAKDLAPYKVIFLPDVQAISDAHAALFRDFVFNGSTLVLTGTNPTGLNEYGDSRLDFALADMLGVSKANLTKPASVSANYGRGKVFWYKSNVGWDYIKETSVFATRPATPTSVNYNNLITPILASFIPQISLLNAHRCIHMEANQRDDKVLVLQFTNFIGICESNPETRTDFPITPTTFGVNIKLYTDRAISSVKTASPNTPIRTALAYSRNGAGCNSAIAFNISVVQYAMVVVELV